MPVGRGSGCCDVEGGELRGCNTLSCRWPVGCRDESQGEVLVSGSRARPVGVWPFVVVMVVAEARVLGRRRRLLLDRQLQLLLRLCVLALGAVLAAGAPQVGAGVPAALCVSLHQQLLLLFLPRLEAVGIGEIGGCERQPLLQQRHELDGGWLAGVHNVRRLCGDDDASKVQAGDDRILTHQECATRGRLLQQPQVTALRVAHTRANVCAPAKEHGGSQLYVPGMCPTCCTRNILCLGVSPPAVANHGPGRGAICSMRILVCIHVHTQRVHPCMHLCASADTHGNPQQYIGQCASLVRVCSVALISPCLCTHRLGHAPLSHAAGNAAFCGTQLGKHSLATAFHEHLSMLFLMQGHMAPPFSEGHPKLCNTPGYPAMSFIRPLSIIHTHTSTDFFVARQTCLQGNTPAPPEALSAEHLDIEL
eukprot:1146473-Pelagomonas_calceolata.AAC.2